MGKERCGSLYCGPTFWKDMIPYSFFTAFILELGQTEVRKWVAKKYWQYMPPDEEEVCCRNDVVVQHLAIHFATRFQEVARLKETTASHDRWSPNPFEMVPAYLLRLHNSQELFVIEPFIEGEYVKYNANNGKILREGEWHNTPHAFSHFTFEESKHQLIVVDIQGVTSNKQSYYTDPQVHSNECYDVHKYGTGNLGISGIALFLYTHRCNPVCKFFDLPVFPLYSDKFSLPAYHFLFHSYQKRCMSNTFSTTITRSRDVAAYKQAQVKEDVMLLGSPKKKFSLHKTSLNAENQCLGSNDTVKTLDAPVHSRSSIMDTPSKFSEVQSNQSLPKIPVPDVSTLPLKASTTIPATILANPQPIDTPLVDSPVRSNASSISHHQELHLHLQDHLSPLPSKLHRLSPSNYSSPISSNLLSPTPSIIEGYENSHFVGLRHFPDESIAIAQYAKPVQLKWPKNSQIPNASTIAHIHFALGKLHQLGTLYELDHQNLQEATGADSDERFSFNKKAYCYSAYYHYQMSAFLGSIEACLALARILTANQQVLEGVSLSDHRRRLKFLKIASKKHCREASFWLGYFYETGDGCSVNLLRAIKYYSKVSGECVASIDKEVLELFSWEMNMTIGEVHANIAQLMIRILNKDPSPVTYHGIEISSKSAISLLQQAREDAVKIGKKNIVQKYEEAMLKLQRVS